MSDLGISRRGPRSTSTKYRPAPPAAKTPLVPSGENEPSLPPPSLVSDFCEPSARKTQRSCSSPADPAFLSSLSSSCLPSRDQAIGDRPGTKAEYVASLGDDPRETRLAGWLGSAAH